MSLLRIESVSKWFGGVEAIHDLDVVIEAGAIHSIIGPNGAGKTTLFNLITGVLAPSAGAIWLDDALITAEPPFQRARRGLARTFQNLQIFFNMSACENVMVGRHRHLGRGLVSSLVRTRAIARAEARCREDALTMLRLVGLERYADAAADSLPYGALKRLEIARALAAEPHLLLLDEPAAGCNARETKELDALIQTIAGRGITVVLVEHDMRLVMNVSARILVLDQGQRLAEGTADEVRRDPAVIAAYLGSEAGRADVA